MSLLDDGRTRSEVRGRRMPSSWPPDWLKLKQCSLDFGMIKYSWISSPSGKCVNVKACSVDSHICN